MTSGSEALNALTAKLQLGRAIRKSFNAFTKVYISSKDKKCRTTELKKYFDLYDGQCGSTLPGEYDTSELILDIVEEGMAYAVHRGLSYCEIHIFLSLYVSSMELLVKKENKEDDKNAATSLRTALKSFKDVIIPTYSNCFSRESFLDLLNYNRMTTFQHFHLYQFVFTQPQIVDIITVKLDVEVPERSLFSLEEGMPECDWIRIKKKYELEQEYEKKLKELEKSEKSAMLEAAANLEVVYQTQLEQFIGRGNIILPEELSTIVGNLAEAHTESIQVMMTKALLKQDIDLTFRLDRIEHLLTQQNIDSSGTYSTAVTTIPSRRYSKDLGNERYQH